MNGEKRRQYKQQYRLEHRQEIRQYRHQYYLEHRQEERQSQQKYQIEHCQEIHKREREYYYQHRQEMLERKKQYHQKLRQDALMKYGGNPPKCACCGEERYDLLCIDHIGGGGSAHRKAIRRRGNGFSLWLKKQSYPKGFRVLCRKCNQPSSLNTSD